jgi:hypothetical protein
MAAGIHVQTSSATSGSQGNGIIAKVKTSSHSSYRSVMVSRNLKDMYHGSASTTVQHDTMLHEDSGALEKGHLDMPQIMKSDYLSFCWLTA